LRPRFCWPVAAKGSGPVEVSASVARVWSWFVRVALTLILLWLGDSAALASTLRWQAPPSCPDDEAAAALIERLGAAMELADSGDFRVRLWQTERRLFAADIVVPGAGERHIEGADCRQIAEAAVLIIVIAHDPLTVADSFSRLTEPRRGDAKGSSGPVGYLGLEFGGDLESVPQITVGGGLVFGLGWTQGLRLEIGVYAWLPRTTTRGPTESASAEIGLYSGALRGCQELPWGGLRLGPCIGVELGVARGEGLAVSRPREVWGLWSAGWLGLSLRPNETRRFVPAVRVEVGTPFERPSFEVNGYGQVFRAAPWQLRASLALHLDLF
jgi:hypothetical protein